MATFTKRGERWRAEVRQQGIYRSKTFSTKRDARQWAASVEARIEQPVASGPETVGDVLKRYADEVTPAKKGARWESVRLAQMQRDAIAAIPAAKISAEDVATWRDRRLKQVQPSSVNRELNLLSAVFEQARREWRLMVANPVRDVRRPKNPRPRDSRFSHDEIERICLALGYEDGEAETTQQQVAVAFLIALETAMRLGELQALRWTDVYLDQRYLTIRDSKNDDSRDVPLSTRAVELFACLQDDRDCVFTFSRDTASVLFRRARIKAGVTDRTFHDARHQAITLLARKLDILDLARMIGHRDLRSLQTYYNATAQEIAERLG